MSTRFCARPAWPLFGLGVALVPAAAGIAFLKDRLALRRRNQSLVVRRIYRRTYGAMKAPEAFSARLHDETDLGSPYAEAPSAIRGTMRSEFVWAWPVGGTEGTQR